MRLNLKRGWVDLHGSIYQKAVTQLLTECEKL